MEIRWRDGYRNRVPVKTAYDELERIRAEYHGDIDPEIVYVVSKDPHAALYDAFEHDESKAAHLHNVELARGMIRSLIATRHETVGVSRVYEICTAYEGGGDEPTKKVYRTVEDVLADPASRAALLGDAIRAALSFRKRFAALQELSQIVDAFDNFLKRQNL